MELNRRYCNRNDARLEQSDLNGSRLIEQHALRDVIVVVPLYRNANLIPGLFRSLVSAADDFAAIRARLLVIVDSPDDEPLREVLKIELPILEAAVPVELHFNEKNIGFIGSINCGFAKAIAEGKDALILNSDVIVFPGAFSEMKNVAYCDHMIGFVSPRSNNATICSLPNDVSYRYRSVEASRDSFEVISRFLPRYRYVPTVVGFCMYIKWTILAEFGVFDPIYGQGYSEENDLVLRANRCGYRSALANHAFVFHFGEKSFSLTEASMNERDSRNGRILRERYPEYHRSIVREMHSPEALTEKSLAGLLPNPSGRLTIAFDWTNIGCYHNGTFEAAKAILLTAADSWKGVYDIVVIGTEQATKFHGLDKISNISVVSYEQCGTYAAIVRVGQPFDSSVTDELALHAPVLAIYMLDTIAMDCQYLDSPDLQPIWQYTFDSIDLVVYISKYTQSQFRRRFRIPNTVVEIASLLSLDVSDYASGDANSSAGKGVLVVGNHFAHKHIDPTISRILAEFPGNEVAVLGSTSIQDPAIRIHEAGNLDEVTVDRLYREARVVLFPSHYEGFGLPIMHAIARKRPVIVRSMPLYDEIVTALGDSVNIHQCDTTEEMVRRTFAEDLEWKDEPNRTGKGQGWGRVVADLERGIGLSLHNVNYDRIVSRFEVIQFRQRLRLQYASVQSAPSIQLPVVRAFGATLIFVALLSALVVVVASGFMAFRGYSALPFWDQWEYVRPDQVFSRLFHNEHLAIISKLLFWIDLTILDGRNIILIAAVYCIQAAHCFVLISAAKLSGLRGRIRSALVVATTVCLLFGAQNFENLTWGFQVQFVLVFAAASTSLLCFAVFIEQSRRGFLLASVAAALVASIEMANGILTFPLLVLFALYYRASWKVLVLLGVAASSAGIPYFFGRTGGSHDLTAAIHAPGSVAEYALVYLGGFFGSTFAALGTGHLFGHGEVQNRLYSAMAFGLGFVTLGATAVGFIASSSRQVRPALVAIVCIFAFAVVSALATALGRIELGLETALAARYAAGSTTAALSAIFLTLWIVPATGHMLVRVALHAAIVIGLVLVAVTQAQFLSIVDGRRSNRDLATTALYSGVRDENALRLVFVDTNLVFNEARYLESRSKSIFADPIYQLLGRKFAGPHNECEVPITDEMRISSGILRISGVARLNPFLLRPPPILIIDTRDKIVGTAFASLQFEQLRLIQLKNIQQNIPWRGHVVADAEGPFRAVLSTKSSCERTEPAG